MHSLPSRWKLLCRSDTTSSSPGGPTIRCMTYGAEGARAPSLGSRWRVPKAAQDVLLGPLRNHFVLGNISMRMGSERAAA